MSDVVSLSQLKFSYDMKKYIIDIENFNITEGERVFIHGPSGCGKTTFLSLISGIICANEGSLKVLGSEFVNSKCSFRDSIRGLHMSYIFQLFNLIPYLTVEENIKLPCKIISKKSLNNTDKALNEECYNLAAALEISNILTKKPTQISVGQQQRVAAARSLMGNPKLIIADEPTSSLDKSTCDLFLKLLFKQCENKNTTLIFVSHDDSLAQFFSQKISLPQINRAITC